jgi:hypothetical protein
MTTLATDRFPPELTQLLKLATTVIGEHVNDHGLCAVCGSAWPCERAVLAEHNLAVLTP